MSIPVAAVLLILLGLPLLAVCISRLPVWRRLTPGRRGSDEYGDFVRRHRLTTAQLARVEAAISGGTKLQDPDERAAVVDGAQRLLDALAPAVARHPRLRLLQWLLVVAWLVGAAWVFGPPLVRGDWGEMPWVLATLLPPWLLQRRQERHLHRAVQLNSPSGVRSS